jgi:hypothetical protein
MKVEHWGTFSVKDHLKSRPFLAEVLLFDKLVVPRPPTEAELCAEGGPPPGKDPAARWRVNKWYPELQRVLLDVLGEHELVVEIPWGGHAEGDWQMVYRKPDELECERTEFTKDVLEQVRLAKTQTPLEAAYLATGGTLSLYVANQLGNKVARNIIARARSTDAEVEPVIAYGSYSKFEQDPLWAASRPEPGGNSPAPEEGAGGDTASYGLFGWEFFVPEDSEKSDVELLEMAAKLASRSDFREARQSFHGWLKQMYAGQVDREDSKAKMLKMLGEYTKLMRFKGLAESARFVAKIAQVAAPLAGLAGHATGIEAGVAASAVALMVEKYTPVPQIPNTVLPAAFVYDARKFFGKR